MQIAKALGKMADQSEALMMLSRIRASLKTNAFNEGTILDAIYRNPGVVRWLYDDFARRNMPSGTHRSRTRVHSVDYKNAADDVSAQEGLVYLRRNCSAGVDFAVFSAFYEFNQQVVKTNFYKPGITALSFRLDPSFLSTAEYPDRPFGLFFVVGSGAFPRRSTELLAADGDLTR